MGLYEELFKYFFFDYEVIKDVIKFYKILDCFFIDWYMVCNVMGEFVKVIYYIFVFVCDILFLNEGCQVKFVYGGVKMFVKQDVFLVEVCRWCIQLEGMFIFYGYIGEERVVVFKKKEMFKKFLIEMFFKIVGDEYKKLEEIGERVWDIGLGCCVFRVELEDLIDEDFNEYMVLLLWKSFYSLNLMLFKEDRSVMLLWIYNDIMFIINMGIKKQLLEEDFKEKKGGVVDEEMKDVEEVKQEGEEGEEVKVEDVEVFDVFVVEEVKEEVKEVIVQKVEVFEDNKQEVIFVDIKKEDGGSIVVVIVVGVEEWIEECIDVKIKEEEDI